MTTIVFISTAWGPEHGGVNSFNMDIAMALANEASGIRVVCVVPHCPSGRNSVSGGVSVLSLEHGAKAFELNPLHASNIVAALKASGISSAEIIIGHDLHTGPASLAVRDLLNQSMPDTCRAGVVLHTAPIAYKYVERGDPTKALNKVKEQEEMLKQSDFVFAVGPRLVMAAKDLLRDSSAAVTEIVPGLAPIVPIQEPPQMFHAITFGRFDARADRLKQSRLALESFASLVGLTTSTSLKDSAFTLFGVDIQDASDVIHAAHRRAGRIFAIYPLPFTRDRSELWHTLARQSVCMMLSIHEGFGLAGWEAISAGVPLILSKNTGLYDLLSEDRRLGRDCLGHVHSLDVVSSPDTADVSDLDINSVRGLLAQIAADQAKGKQSALRLREMCVNAGFTWQAAARQILAALDLPVPSPMGPVGVANHVISVLSRPPRLAKTHGTAALLDRMYGSISAARRIALVGTIGSGKTHVAKRFYERHSQLFSGGYVCIELDPRAHLTAEELLLCLSAQLQIDLSNLTVRLRCPQTLLHLDNVDSEKAAVLAAELSARLPGVSIIASGRFSNAATYDGFDVVEVPPLSVDHASAMLIELSGKDLGAEDVARLARAVMQNPQALTLVAGHLRCNFGVEDILKALDTENIPPAAGLASPSSQDPRRVLDASVSISWGILSDQLKVMSVKHSVISSAIARLAEAPAAGFSVEMGTMLTGLTRPELTTAVAQMVQLSLALPSDSHVGHWTLPFFVRNYIRGMYSTEERKSLAERLCQWNVSRLAATARDRKHFFSEGEKDSFFEWLSRAPAKCQQDVVIHGQYVASFLGRIDTWRDVAQSTRGCGVPEVETACLDILATHAFVHDDYVRAQKLVEQKMEIEVQYGLGSLQESKASLAVALIRQGLWDSSSPQVAQALACLQQGSIVHPTLLYVHVAMAQSLMRIGRLREGAKIFRDIERQAIAQEEMRIVGLALDGQGDTLALAGDDSAMRMYQKSLEVFIEQNDEINIAATYGKIADFYGHWGRHAEAVAIRRRHVLPLAERRGDMLSWAKTQGKVGASLMSMGEFAEAEFIQRDVLKIFQDRNSALGVAVTKKRLGEIDYAKDGIPNPLLEAHRSTIEIMEAVGDTRSAMQERCDYAGFLVQLGRTSEARSLLDMTIPYFRKVEANVHTAAAKTLYAESLMRDGRLHAAQRKFEYEIMPLLDRPNFDDGVTLSALLTYADLLAVQGKVHAARDLLTSPRVTARIHSTQLSAKRAGYMGLLGAVYCRIGSREEGIRMMDDCMKAYDAMGSFYLRDIWAARIRQAKKGEDMQKTELELLAAYLLNKQNRSPYQ